ncbi:CRP/FNR family transcriptional regulator, anaerobic regulatory protein [Solimonas aquatica]|uniref:CRP/FNR family transcriptional regulator, anaerobic regulatory protein n=1 Tax=Solimonas aquatica TaxID=489703 RepID=A0A1H8ZN42_9GAMM|nr:Crp/Fnr family transcriptional regulator [Solimonas aquatica]SEP65795.1 CRP/FNR family transcriptional regulator, anaerobic regulatory protein [Solimonas aquatica]
MTDVNNTQTVSQFPCDNCLRSGRCLGSVVVKAGADHQRASEVTVVQLQRGQPLFRTGDAANAVYVVQSGALKARRTSYEGDEEILAFRLPGDAIGLDALGQRMQNTEAVALCSTRVCRVPLEALHRELRSSPEVSEMLFDDVGREFERLHEHLQTERRPAQARIAAFLLAQLKRRQRLFGAQIDRFTLPMTRVDLGRYLALATETVSRMFTRLQQDGVISCDGNAVQVLKATALEAMAGAGAEERAPALAKAA